MSPLTQKYYGGISNMLGLLRILSRRIRSASIYEMKMELDRHK